MESHDALRFVNAENVETPAGRLNEFDLVSLSDAKLGKLDGVLVNPLQRQVCYYVVKPGGWLTSRRYLMPVMLTKLGAEEHTLQVDLEPDQLRRLPETNAEYFPPFSDVDVVDAMFSTHAD